MSGVRSQCVASAGTYEIVSRGPLLRLFVRSEARRRPGYTPFPVKSGYTCDSGTERVCRERSCQKKRARSIDGQDLRYRPFVTQRIKRETIAVPVPKLYRGLGMMRRSCSPLPQEILSHSARFASSDTKTHICHGQ